MRRLIQIVVVCTFIIVHFTKCTVSNSTIVCAYGGHNVFSNNFSLIIDASPEDEGLYECRVFDSTQQKQEQHSFFITLRKKKKGVYYST